VFDYHFQPVRGLPIHLESLFNFVWHLDIDDISITLLNRPLFTRQLYGVLSVDHEVSRNTSPTIGPTFFPRIQKLQKATPITRQESKLQTFCCTSHPEGVDRPDAPAPFSRPLPALFIALLPFTLQLGRDRAW
jgi:hypothetical protein